jgi:hypothetical protein
MVDLCQGIQKILEQRFNVEDNSEKMQALGTEIFMLTMSPPHEFRKRTISTSTHDYDLHEPVIALADGLFQDE